VTAFFRAERRRQPPGNVGINLASRLSRGLVGAWLPVGGGYLDCTPAQNHAFVRNAGGGPIPIGGPANGAAFEFPTVGFHWRAGSSTPAATSAGFSAAIWIRLPASLVAFGQHLTRDPGSGTDWALFTDNVSRRLAYGFNGGVTHAATSTVDADTWNLWHISIDSAGNSAWYTNGVPNGTATGRTIRTATGMLRFNERNDGASASGTSIGRVYLWNRATSAEEARMLFRNEWGLFAPETVFYSPPPTGVVISAVTATEITETEARPRYTIDFP
jgi:hypothetical protein